MKANVLFITLALVISIVVCLSAPYNSNNRIARVTHLAKQLKRVERELKNLNRVMSEGPSLPTFASPSTPSQYSAPWSSGGSSGSSTSLPTIGITPGNLPVFARPGTPTFNSPTFGNLNIVNPPTKSTSNPKFKLPDFNDMLNGKSKNPHTPNKMDIPTLPKVPGNKPGSLPIFARPSTPTFSSPSFYIPTITSNKKPVVNQIPTLPSKPGMGPLNPPKYPSMVRNPPSIPLPKPSASPPPANKGGASVTKWIMDQQGKPYSQAQDKRNGPNYYDCSALVKAAWANAGKNLPATTHGYPKSGMKQVSKDEMKAGDIVYREGHVGMYVGNGKIVSAESRAGVKVRPVAEYQKYLGFTTVYRP
jgi:cell wall-associated NlpC family hydrolase